MKAEPQMKHDLLDAIRSEYGLKTDAQVSRLIGISIPLISKMRHGKPVTADTKITIMRRLAWSLAKVDKLCPPKDE